MQLCRIIYYFIVPWLLYMFRAILSLIIRSILTVITASGFYLRVPLSAAVMAEWELTKYKVDTDIPNTAVFYIANDGI